MQDETVKSLIPVKEIIFASIICLAMTIMDITAFPAVLFINITISDITPLIFTIMINQWIVIFISGIAIKFLCPQLFKQLGLTNLKSGLRSFWLPILILILSSNRLLQSYSLCRKNHCWRSCLLYRRRNNWRTIC